ncbi:arylsulfatase [Reichenbachiella sp. MALMAid0571]|uniref:sulfatase family protein n=1 Tax=Reichenbachiella sp. MALMAid0571 TaxID=3143939 RepID=UPI0032DF5476
MHLQYINKVTQVNFIATVISIFVLAFLKPFESFSNSNRPPNVIVIFADDLGYGDVGCYGATKVSTPNIDQLAREGMMFTDAHSASAVCTPSRYALLTGQYPFRANDGKGVWGPLPRNHKLIVDTNDLTIGKVMKQQGYATACIGKWHLGFGNTSPTDWNSPLLPGPLQLGFDYYFGVPFVNSGPPYVYVENDEVYGLESSDPLILNGQPITPTQLYPDKSPNTFSGGIAAHALYKDDEIGMTLAGKATEWIEKNKANPFFLYLATTNIHHPFSPNTQFKGTSESGRYGDFVHELDWIVGEVMKALEDAKVSDNTLVIFTSDNGGMLNVGGQEAWKMGHKMNGELLGFKFDGWEGGHRIPFIARWPGNISPNSKSDQLISNVDFLATVASLTGYELKEKDAPDSFNIMPVLLENTTKPIRTHLVVSPYKSENLVLRVGDWVYIGAQGGGGWNGGKPGDHILGGPTALSFAREVNSDIEDGKFKPNIPKNQLYNLRSDISQSTNVSEQEAQRTAMMREMLRIIRQSKYTRNQ